MSEFITGGELPILLRSRVNSQDGFAIFPDDTDDSGGIFFDTWGELRHWVGSLVAQVQDADPTGLRSYDSWVDEL